MAKGIYSARNVRVLGGFVVLAALILAYVMYKPAVANHTPADKVVASGSDVEHFTVGQNQLLLSGKLRTSKPTDLMFHATFECSILTRITTGQPLEQPSPAPTITPLPPPSVPPANDTATTTGQIQAWIEVDDDPASGELPEVGQAHRVVPIEAASSPPQNGSTPNTGNKDNDSATFCNRTYTRTVDDQEDDGQDRESDYIETKTANAFNWLLLNTGAGIHHIRLMADLELDANNTCSRNTADGMDTSCTSGFVGNRTLIVEPAKLANDASTVTP
jgi:hypothetical protein